MEGLRDGCARSASFAGLGAAGASREGPTVVLKISTLCAQVGDGLLEELLQHLDCRGEQPIDDAPSKAARRREVERRIREGPDNAASDLQLLLDRLEPLAKAAGERVIFRLFHKEQDVLEALRGLDSALARAIWIYIHRDEAFIQIERLMPFEKGFERPQYWNGYRLEDGRGLDALALEEDALKAALQDAFHQRDGYISNIVLEADWRPAARDSATDTLALQITIFRDAPATLQNVFEGDDLVRQSVRPAIEALVLIDPSAATIDVVAERGGEKLRHVIMQAVLHYGLGVTATPARLAMRRINLDRLKSRIALPAPNGHPVLRARLVELGIRPLDSPGDYVLIRTEGQEGDAWSALERNLRPAADQIPLDVVEKATIEITFAPRAGRQGERCKLMKLAYPHGCTTKGWSEDERLAGDACLELWELRDPA